MRIHKCWLELEETFSPCIIAKMDDGNTVISNESIEKKLLSVKNIKNNHQEFYQCESGDYFYKLTFEKNGEDLSLIYDFTRKIFYSIVTNDMDFNPKSLTR